MKAVQLNYAEAGVRLQDLLKALGQQINTTAQDTAAIKQLLREGFRLPAADD
jgi:hypothetical protein